MTAGPDWNVLLASVDGFTDEQLEAWVQTYGWIVLPYGDVYKFTDLRPGHGLQDSFEVPEDVWARWRDSKACLWFESEDDAQDAAQRIRERADAVSEGFVDWDDPAFWTPPDPRVFVPNVLLETQIGTIYSRGGVGKSLLSLDVVVGLCVRGDTFGVDVDPATVIYIDRENSKRGLLKRLLAMGVTASDAALLTENMHYSLLGAIPALDTEAGGKWLMNRVRRTGARFVVIDTLSKVVEGDENANPTWQGVHNHTMTALKAEGITVLQLDHTGKDSDRGQRGASAKRDNADVVWHLDEVQKDYMYRLRNEKDRDGDFGGIGACLYLIREESPYLHHRLATEPEVLAAMASGMTEEQDDMKAKILQASKEAGGKFSQRAAERAVSGNTDAKRDAYKALIATGELNSDGSYPSAPEVRPSAPEAQ